MKRLKHLPNPQSPTVRTWYPQTSVIAESNFRIGIALVMAALVLGMGGPRLWKDDITGMEMFFLMVFLPVGVIALQIALNVIAFAYIPPGKPMAFATREGLVLPIHRHAWVRVFGPSARANTFIPWTDIQRLHAHEDQRIMESGPVPISSLRVYLRDTAKPITFNTDNLGGIGVGREIAAIGNAALQGILPQRQAPTTRVQVRPLGWLLLCVNIVISLLLAAEGVHMASQSHPPGTPAAALWVSYDYLFAAFILLMFLYFFPNAQARMRACQADEAS